MIKYKTINYPYVLQEDVTYELPEELWGSWEDPWIKLDGGKLTLKKGYAIDGVTAWFDFEGLIEGAFPHDALMQLIYDHKVLPKEARWAAHRVFHKESAKAALHLSVGYPKRVARDLSASLAFLGLLIGHDIGHKVLP